MADEIYQRSCDHTNHQSELRECASLFQHDDFPWCASVEELEPLTPRPPIVFVPAQPEIRRPAARRLGKWRLDRMHTSVENTYLEIDGKRSPVKNCSRLPPDHRLGPFAGDETFIITI